jgi:hypothetical protein
MVVVNFVLPPSDECKELSIPDTYTIADAIKFSKSHFQADPSGVYGARIYDDGDSWLPLDSLVTSHGDGIDLWICKNPSGDMSASRSGVPPLFTSPMSPGSDPESSMSFSMGRSPMQTSSTFPPSPAAPIIRAEVGRGIPSPRTGVASVPCAILKPDDYGARLAELQRQTQQPMRVCVLCYNFFDYNVEDALAALMAGP